MENRGGGKLAACALVIFGVGCMSARAVVSHSILPKLVMFIFSNVGLAKKKIPS